MAMFNSKQLDPLIHGRVRLGMMAYLASVSTASFGEIKTKLQTSDGNLSTHLRKLEQAGYVQVKKRFSNRKPLTTIELSKAGRSAWIGYLEQMQNLLQQTNS
ncbi:Transcriptional regulator, MarR family [hydrothermal vent metagenome]|uniref:Transcriptional regulator, MarR family n=1 Tax=hydrothermal vent metagenome TaxID=652676 RepID=A0A3B0RK21_9ZZZZ